ncbi:transposase [Frankia sp. AiPs1]|nr:transposase [Frankia sp. AiPs1]
MLAATGRRTMCGMLLGAGLSALWPHDRAHRFFNAARWSPDRVGLALARLVVDRLAGPGPLTVAADAAYAGDELRSLPASVTWTTRLRKDAALYTPAPPRTGRHSRPRTKGDRLGGLAQLAATARFTPVTVTRYGQTVTVHAAMIRCLWYGVFAARPVTVVLIRERAGIYDLALVTTDTLAKPARIIERYAARWSIEVAIFDLAGALRAMPGAARRVFRRGHAPGPRVRNAPPPR